MADNGSEGKDGHDFGLRFRLLLGYYDLTLRDVSEATGAAISTVGTWKNGRIPASPKIIEKLSQLFKVSPAYLLHGGVQSSKNGVDQQICEIKDSIDLKVAMESHGNAAGKIQRQKIERYIQCYLDEAEKFEGGLEHAWLQLLKEFPLNWFYNMEDYIERKPPLTQ
ncbi:MAG: helix-turn-helix domain-containing protein [Puniceicoccales bacterium]|jgi:transcriptional regulator with XRE-family HTH domain|nr:helix-turn-helix domain-containing protein [Puniceicoccales bacterium]